MRFSAINATSMTKRSQLIPAAVFAAFFMYSCAGSDNYAPESMNKRTADSSVVMDYNKDVDGSGNSAFGTTSEKEEDSKNDFKVLARQDSFRTILPTSAAAINVLDSTHMFIRTADVRCRVDEVDDATYEIEHVVKSLGGYVSDTRLSSNQTYQQQTRVSDDSIRQVTRFSVTNYVTIRVPARQLDSLLKAIAPLVDYMDYRNVNVNDITLDQLAKQLEQKRIAKYNAMLNEKVVNGNAKASSIIDAATSMLNQQERADNAFLASLRLNDQVAYATLNLQLYQPETSQVAMIYHEKPAEPYSAGIGERIADSAYAGWKGFSYILSGIVLLWPLWLVGALAWFFIRRQMKKQVKAA